jgi:hypothetical protein
VPGWIAAIARYNPVNWAVEAGRGAVAAQVHWGTVASFVLFLAGFTLGRIPLGPNGLVRIEASLAILLQAGIPDRLCGFAGDLFGLYLGAAVHESEAWQGTQDFGEEQTEMMRQWFMSMPADQFPNLLALADPLAQGTVEERFELGLDVLIRGLASYIP